MTILQQKIFEAQLYLLKILSFELLLSGLSQSARFCGPTDKT